MPEHLMKIVQKLSEILQASIFIDWSLLSHSLSATSFHLIWPAMTYTILKLLEESVSFKLLMFI